MEAANAAYDAALTAHTALQARGQDVESQLGRETAQQAKEVKTLRVAELLLAQAREHLEQAGAPLQMAKKRAATAKSAVKDANATLREAQKTLADVERDERTRRTQLLARLKDADITRRNCTDRAARVTELSKQQATLLSDLGPSSKKVAWTERLKQRAYAKANPVPATRLPPNILGRIFELAAVHAMDDAPPTPALYPALVAAFVCETWREAALHPLNNSMWCYLNLDLDVVARAGSDWLDRILLRSRSAAALSPLNVLLHQNQPSTEAHRPIWQRLADVMDRVQHLAMTLHSLSGASEPARLVLVQPAPHLRSLIFCVQNIVDRHAVPPVIFPGSHTVVDVAIRGCESLENVVEPLVRGCGAELRRVAFDGLFAGGRLTGVLVHAPQLGHLRVANAAATSQFFDCLVDVCPRLRTVELERLRQSIARTQAGPYDSQLDINSLRKCLATRVRRDESFRLSLTECDKLVVWDDGPLQADVGDPAGTKSTPSTEFEPGTRELRGNTDLEAWLDSFLL